MKKRYLAKSEKNSLLALTLYQHWCIKNTSDVKKKTFKDFIHSNFYSAFMKFSSFVNEENVKDSIEFMTWLNKNGIGIDKWCKRSLYEKFMGEIFSQETVERALEKYVINADKWASDYNLNWSDYASNASNNRIMSDIRLYKLSPWIIFCHEPLKKRIEIFPDEYLDEISDIIDMEYWNKRIKRNKEAVKLVKETLLDG